MNLPTELQVKIVKRLPWQDVLQVRKTCKTLLEVTQTWEIWAHLVNEHISSKLDPPRLERPIERYSSRELEDLLLRWKGTEIAWKTDGGLPTRQITFISTTGIPRYSHLVKGGRWYLTTAYGTAEVTCYDLEAETIVGAQLIPPQAHTCRESDVAVALEVHETPYLEFTMAFTVFDHRNDDESDYVDGLSSDSHYRHKAINIWRVVCILDESGRATGLSATQIAAIPNRVSFYAVFSLSLRGPLIAMAARDYVQGRWFVIIVDWERARARGQEQYPMRIMNFCDNMTTLYLLPNSQLLCHRDGKFLLFDYSAAKETTMVSKDGIDLERVLVWSLPARNQASNRIHLAVSCVENTTRVVFWGGNSLMSLSFKDNSREPPPLVKVMALPEYCAFYALALGTNRGSVFSKKTNTFQLLTYKPDVGVPPTASPLQVVVSRSLGPFSGFPQQIPNHPIDQDTGRIVIPATSHKRSEASVLDFSHYI